MAPTLRQFKRRIALTLESYPWLVCEVDHRIAAFSYAGPHRTRAAYQWSVESAIYVHSDYRRIGIASALYQTLMALLQIQGYNSVYAGITLPNKASVGFHRSMGFTQVGIYRAAGFKLGRWRDAVWYQHMLNDPLPENPPPPLPLHRVKDTAEWKAAMRKGSSVLGHTA